MRTTPTKSAILAATIALLCLPGCQDGDAGLTGSDANEAEQTADGQFQLDPTAVSLPNILFILADDFGLDASPGYFVGMEKPPMPNLERLQAQGLSFDAAWSYPTCSPTRASILTGRYGLRTGVQSPEPPDNGIPLTETSIYQVLANETPYSTAHFGKWHLSNNANGGAGNPNLMGVEHFFGYTNAAQAPYWDFDLNVNGSVANQPGYATSVFAEEAIRWINDQTDPWFAWLAFTAPHAPFHLPPTELHSRTDLTGSDADVAANPREYYFAMLEAMDTEMGRVLSNIDLQGTLVIFMGDNGTPTSVAQLPFERGTAKGSPYQGGVNVPLVAAGSGVTRSGQREPGIVVATDLFATFQDLAGAGVGAIHDSFSILPFFGSTGASGRTFGYSATISDVGEGPGWTVRNARYKLIRFDSGQDRLFDLSVDPYESNDLNDGALTAGEQSAFAELASAGAAIRNWT
jgi:arylsulfatase A-like enzyme